MSAPDYLILAQLAANFRRFGLTTTAELVDKEAAILTERFGPLLEWRVSPRDVPVWLDQYVATLRQHAIYQERMGNPAEQLGFLLGVSVLAQAVAEGESLTPDFARRLVGTAQDAVARALERVNGSKGNEFGKARFLSNQKFQETRRAALNQQARDQKIAELNATKARLEQALGQE